MKKFTLSVLYVFSIVLAIGIGIGQAGKVKSDISGSLPDCNKFVMMFDCSFLNKKSADECFGVQLVGGSAPTPPGYNLNAIRRSTDLDTVCTYPGCGASRDQDDFGFSPYYCNAGG